MPVLVTPGMVRQLRAVHGASLAQTYVRRATVAVLDGNNAPTYNAWGNALVAPGPPDPPRPCLLGFSEQHLVDERGRTVAKRPLLRVRHDDPVQAGDLVFDVTDQDGRVLLSQAAVIRATDAPNRGASLTRLLELEANVSVADFPEDPA